MNEKSGHNKVKVKKYPLWGKILIAVFSLLIFLTIIEAISTIVLKVSTPIFHKNDKPANVNIVYDYDMIFYNAPLLTTNISFSDSRRCRFTTNKTGFREDKEIPLDKPENEYRILCVGDSSTYGLYIDQAQTFPAQLENLLNSEPQSSKSYRVLNGGCAGFTSFQAMRFLEKWLPQIKPDLIILSVGFNDSVHTTQRDSQADYRRGFFSWLTAFVRNSNTYKLGRALLLGKRNRQEDTPDRFVTVRVKPDEYEANLRSSILLARNFKSEIIFCPISVPLPYLQVMQKVGDEEKVLILNSENSLWRAYCAVAEGLVEYHGIGSDCILKLEKQGPTGEEYGDLKSLLLRQSTNVLDDEVHPNPIGCLAIAEDLAKVIP